MENKPMKCRVCRHVLLESPLETIVNRHGTEDLSDTENPCSDKNLFYLKEESLPSWINSMVQESGWTKGKLKCPNPSCTSRVGSFDFVSPIKCTCNQYVVPSVHLVSSKVDWVPLSMFNRT